MTGLMKAVVVKTYETLVRSEPGIDDGELLVAMLKAGDLTEEENCVSCILDDAYDTEEE